MSAHSSLRHSFSFPYNGETRQADGLLVQAVSPEGEHRWFWRSRMPLRKALVEIAAELDALGLKVEVISSPTTIWRDLQGTRGERIEADEPWSPGRSTGPGDTSLRLPEARLLGGIGRLDLLATQG